MIFLPEIKKDDKLYGIILLPQLLYKNKYLYFIVCLYVFGSFGYFCLFMYYAITDWKNFLSLEMLVAALTLEATISSLSILDEEKTISEVNQLRRQHFWDNNFLNNCEKRNFDRSAKIFVYLHYVAWIFVPLLGIAQGFSPYCPKYFSFKSLPYLARLTITYFIRLSIVFGYYLANAHECFFAYTILHGYFQMNTLSAYLRNEFYKYKKMSLNEKLRSYEYQTVIGGVLLRCIKQHKKLTEYGQKVSSVYGKWMIFHFLVSVPIFSTAGYCYFYDPMDYKLPLILCVIYLIICGSLYHLLGDVFSSGYKDFYKELSEVEWYSLNKANRRLYFMFLTFAQMEHRIEVLPSVPICRPLMTQSLKMTYSGITLLCWMKSRN